MLTFTLPAPPGKNALYRNTTALERDRARVLGRPLRGRKRTQDYNRWRRVAEQLAHIDGNKARSWEPITGPVEVEIVVATKHDNDALVPAIFDLFTTLRVWLDDKQVAKHSVSRRAEDTRDVIVTVRELSEQRRTAA